MVGVEMDGAADPVGEEGVMAPVGPQLGLGAEEPGAANDETMALVGGLGYLGFAALG